MSFAAPLALLLGGLAAPVIFLYILKVKRRRPVEPGGSLELPFAQLEPADAAVGAVRSTARAAIRMGVIAWDSSSRRSRELACSHVASSFDPRRTSSPLREHRLRHRLEHL